jgi:wyosine [tRNA(Phe)-imidazoG37] synthetase (radical SAM superfamily)
MPYKYVGNVADMHGLKDVLKIDFSPPKTCTYDCVFCDVGRTNFLTNARSKFHPAEDVFNEIRDHISDKGAPQHILLTGSGEPTLYARFGKLTRMIKDEFRNIKLVVYSNCSLLKREDVRNEVAVCDIVGGHFNTVSEDEFSKIHRPHRSIKLHDVMDGLKKFRNEHNGIFELDTLLLRGINDNERNVEGLSAFVKDIRPSRYRVFAIKYKGQALAKDFLELVKKRFEDFPFAVEYNF